MHRFKKILVYIPVDDLHAPGPSLQHAATSGTASQRGWAIAALSRMGGLDVDGWLLEYHDNAEYQMLYRTWAAAARLQMVETLPALMERAHLVNQFPALAYPLEQRILRHVVEDESRMTAESLIGLTIETPALTNVLTNLITRLGPRQLAEAMVHAKDQEVRRRSAGYLATIGQNNSTAAAEVVRVLSFDAQAESVPWADGPLFLPAVSWQQSDARELIGNLVRWHLWCDLRERAQEQRQIDNNLRSVTLAGIAGFQIPSTADTASLLGTWSKVVGREGIEKILREQDVLKDPRYAAALK